MVVGDLAPGALAKLANDCRFAISGLLNCIGHLNMVVQHAYIFGKGDLLYELRSQIDEEIPGVDLLDAVWMISQDGTSLTKRYAIIGECLTHFLQAHISSKNFAGRVQTALRLISEANHQSNDAVGLTLYVSAIEALVCRKGPDITKMFSENVATLLEPDSFCRRAATKKVGQIYNLRSEVIHGSSVACQPEDVHNARVLAIAVLKAILQLLLFRRKMGEQEVPDQVLNLLADEYPTPGIPAGVDDSEARLLWRVES